MTQSQCAVCAVSQEEVEEAVGDWIGPRPKIISLCPTRLADVWDDIHRVADALGVTERGRAASSCAEKSRRSIIEKTASCRDLAWPASNGSSP